MEKHWRTFGQHVALQLTMTMSRFHFYSPESCVKVASMEDMQWRKLDVEERLQKEQQGARLERKCGEQRPRLSGQGPCFSHFLGWGKAALVSLNFDL